MALKRLKTKQSKRVSARLKYKINKKVRDHNKKERRLAKKNPKKGSKKQKLIQIPNICPFKEDILKEVEEAKKKKEDEQKKRRELAKQANAHNSFKSLEEMVNDAEVRGSTHVEVETGNANEITYKSQETKEQSLKQFFKEFKKVVECADVILEVVDARDPLGTRCPEVEKTIRGSSNKRLILVLNKADLVPKENLQQWIKYFRRFGPVTAFKASTQEQSNRIGRRKFHQMTSEKARQGSVCIGAELLMSMLGNYCRNKGFKVSIRVGIVGIPNVGKSSIINSLIRGKACKVGGTPGVTRLMQEVELDSKIKLIDCPGIVFSSAAKNDSSDTVLKNVQRIGDIKDPFTAAENVLKRGSKEYFSKLYDITDFDSYEEFFAKTAARMGKFLKGGIPDVSAAAKLVLNDWNNGKIKYCTQPPEMKDDIHLSAAIVSENVREFEDENFENMTMEVIENFTVKDNEVLKTESTGPIELMLPRHTTELMEGDQNVQSSLIIDESSSKKSKKRKVEESKDEQAEDPAMLLEGNQRINRNIKQMQKKKKKQEARHEKKMGGIADVLNSFNIGDDGEKSYDFDKDYIMDN